MRELRIVRPGSAGYSTAFEWQRELHRRRVADEIPDVLLLLEHHHVYTLGRNFKDEHLLVSREFLRERGIDTFESDRGGSITYHGPGQLVGYPILDLRHPGRREEHPDSIKYLRALEHAIILSLRSGGIVAGRREGQTGVWIGNKKIASIGVNITRGVTKHGFALNVATDLSFFEGMVPCGISGVEMTSVEEILRRQVSLSLFEDLLGKNVSELFHRRSVEGTLEDLGIAHPEGAEAGAKIAEERRVIPFPKTSSG